MSSIRKRADNGQLFFDFRFSGFRCREQTTLDDTPTNRKKMEKVLARIESEIKAGTFDYAAYFPNSKGLARLQKAKAQKQLSPQPVMADTAQAGVAEAASSLTKQAVPQGPTFETFANQWMDDHCIEWRRSHIKSLQSTLHGRLIPHFGNRVVSSITKSDVLAYRATLAKVPGRGSKPGLSAKRINEIMGTLRQILEEAADQYEFTSPMNNVKRLRVRKSDVQPFTLNEVQRILATVRADFKDYFTVRFFTGMRTGEVHGLKWKYVDFDNRLLLVRETFVLGEDEYTKTDGSQREIQMSQPVIEALLRQRAVSWGKSEYVFCNLLGEPLDNTNFTKRVWYPLLRHLGYELRRPYQMRHTAATLWLASGEAPEWIARQLGHTSTEMLFRTYSRYVPNLTRQDGSAMERLLASQMATGTLVHAGAGGSVPVSATGGALFVPVSELPPMPTPRPRGLAGRHHAGERSPTSITSCPSSQRQTTRVMHR